MRTPIIKPDLEIISGRHGQLVAGQTFESITLEDCNYSLSKAIGVKFEEARLNNVDLSSIEIKKVDLTDVYADHCLLFGSIWPDGGWLRVVIKNSMMSGLVLSNSLLKEVVFEECKLDLVNFRFSKLKNVAFINCHLGEADFHGADLRDARFDNCELAGAEFSGAKLEKVDFRGSRIATIKGLSSLKGAIISSSQLFELSYPMATALGMIIED